MNEILAGVAVADPLSPVSKPFSHKCRCSRAYFLDAPGGTGKTFTIEVNQLILKLRGQKVTAVATPAVAASLLDRGRTANSEFKIPIHCFSDTVSNMSMDSKLASDIRQANMIIWDEIVICVRYCLETIDRTLWAIMKSPNVLFGGKCILFSVDFRQILPVAPRRSRGRLFL